MKYAQRMKQIVINNFTTPDKVTEIVGCCCCSSTNVSVFFFYSQQRPHGRDRPARLGLLRCLYDTRPSSQQVLQLSLFPSKFSVTTASLRISSLGLGIHQKFRSGTKQSFMHTKHILSVTNFICSLSGGTETSSVFLWALNTCRGTIKVFYSVKFQNVGGSFFHCKFPCFFLWL